MSALRASLLSLLVVGAVLSAFAPAVQAAASVDADRILQYDSSRVRLWQTQGNCEGIYLPNGWGIVESCHEGCWHHWYQVADFTVFEYYIPC
jgi:hypothetical protein